MPQCQSLLVASRLAVQRKLPADTDTADEMLITQLGGGGLVTVTVEVASPTFPAASWNRNVTVVVPIGNSVDLSTSTPPTCGCKRTGAGSTLSVAVPPARKAARAGDKAGLDVRFASLTPILIPNGDGIGWTERHGAELAIGRRKRAASGGHRPRRFDRQATIRGAYSTGTLAFSSSAQLRIRLMWVTGGGGSRGSMRIATNRWPSAVTS